MHPFAKPSTGAVLAAMPGVGAQLTEGLCLPKGEVPEQDIRTLQVNAKPAQGKVISVVNVLSSVDVGMVLQRLSSEDLLQLRCIGNDLKGHTIGSRDEHAPLVERLAESFHIVQSRSILAINFIGPERWRRIPNQEAVKGRSYARLSEQERETLRSNVHSVARNLAALPEQALRIIGDLRKLAPQSSTWVDPASCFPDYIAKRAVECNHEAWRFRKVLEGRPHEDDHKKVIHLDPQMRLFAGLMGLGTFQMLREAGIEACTGLVRLGNAILDRGMDQLDLTGLRTNIQSKQLVVGVPFRDGSSVLVSPDIMTHFRDYHHGLWLTNRALSWLLPYELHQPARPEHTPIEYLEPHIANQTCIHIIALATSLAQDARVENPLHKDLFKNAAPGNPFELCVDLFNERGERIS